jgi:hypothetical protein
MTRVVKPRVTRTSMVVLLGPSCYYLSRVVVVELNLRLVDLLRHLF